MREGTAEQDDSAILGLLREQRHAEAFELLLDRHESRVFRLCHALLRNRAEAEDAAQESLVRVWKSLASFDGRAALSTWIHAITRNRCLTAIERRRTELSLSDEAVASQVEAIGAALPADGSDGNGDKARAVLRELVEELPENYRRCLLLYYYEESAVDEVARMLALPVGTVKTNLHRARALLLRRLGQLGLADVRLWLEAGT